MIKEKPILFSELMVRAILDGRKNQTRKIVKTHIPDNHPFQGWIVESTDKKEMDALHGELARTRY